MKINVGDYIRTKTGIHKIFEIKENATVWKYLCDKKPTGEWYGSYEYITTRDENIIKSAEGTPRGLLDLIEVGDYVNGHEVLEKYHDELRLNTENDILCFIKENDIKTIVTKEQFEAMQYVIKENRI